MSYPTKPMEREDIEFYVNIRSLSQEAFNDMYERMRSETHVLDALEKHEEAIGTSLDKKVRMMILYLSEGTIGYAVRYFKVVTDWANLEQKTHVTLDDFTMKVFPWGYPDFSKMT